MNESGRLREEIVEERGENQKIKEGELREMMMRRSMFLPTFQANFK